MKAVIMAGGQGSRLRPLTCDLAKPMVPVANRPMMEYIIELLCRHGFRDIAVTTYYLQNPLKVLTTVQPGASSCSIFKKAGLWAPLAVSRTLPAFWMTPSS